MRVPYSWLRGVVTAGAPGWDVSSDDLEQTLIRIGHEVEEIIPSEVRPYVLRAVIVKSPGSVVPGSATTTRSPMAKFVAPQTMSRTSGSPTSTFTARIGFLNSVSSSISTTRPIRSGPATGPSGMTSSTSCPIPMSVRANSSDDTSQPGAPAATTSRSQL